MPAATDHMSLSTAEQAKLRAELDAVVEWIAEALEETVTGQTSHPAGPRSRRAKKGSTEEDSSLPMHWLASDVEWVLANTLNAWITHVTTNRFMTHPGRLGVSAAARWLNTARHVTGLALTPEGPQALDELCYAIAQARRVVDRHEHPAYVGACPVCKGDLYARRGAEKITCRECERVVTTRADNDQRIDVELDGRLFTAPELVDVVEARLGIKITTKTIRNLARYRITTHGQDRRGHALYRCGDVLDALAGRAG